jgi:chromosome segregation ATPase
LEAIVKSSLLVPTVLLAVLAASACDRPAQAGGRGSGASYYDATREYAYEQRDGFRAEMEQAVDKLEARVAELRAKAARSGQAVKADTQRLIDDIEARLPDLRRELAAIGNATREGWQDFKRKFHDTFDDLSRRLDRAFS